jgi:hypothetical protein
MWRGGLGGSIGCRPFRLSVPLAGVLFHRPIGLADWPETEVVGPSNHRAVELRYHRLLVQQSLISFGRFAKRCADTGTAGANRSRAVGAGAASQRESTNSSDGNSGTGGIGECTNGPGERSTRAGEVLWPAAAQVWHAAGEPGAGGGIARGVARGSGAAAQRNRITERAHQGIRGPDGENRQGELPASRTAQTGDSRLMLIVIH